MGRDFSEAEVDADGGGVDGDVSVASALDEPDFGVDAFESAVWRAFFDLLRLMSAPNCLPRGGAMLGFVGPKVPRTC